MNIDDTLAERGKRYGDFKTHALITQDIKNAMQKHIGWARLSPDKKECLEMIAHKIGRILNGDSEYHDSWHDIVGYTKLVADRIATPVQAIGSLAQVPERPFQQRQWVQDAYNKNVQARDIVLSHHAQAYAGQGPQEAPDQDNHISDISSMMSSHYNGGQQNA